MKKVALLILDGWGHGDKTKSDAIYNANTPYMDSLEANKPNAELLTDGEHVGLPKGQMGNSEVGHLNIGAGRIVYQDFTRINKAIEDNQFQNNPILLEAFEKAKSNNSKIHFMGLVSDGGVHSHQNHLKVLCDMAAEQGLKNVFIHAFTDGRDCDPNSGLGQLGEIENHLKNSAGQMATVVGRYYAMDRRTDRCREISIALTQKDFPEYEMNTLNLAYFTMTNYDKTFKNVEVIFDKENLEETLGEVISKKGLTQVRIAETEKYPHVTFFFSGGREKEFSGEKRILINSPKVATYDLQPEMSALLIQDAIVNEMNTHQPDFICLNFANTDMVGHTGVYEAILKAAETVDGCVKTVVENGEKLGYSFIIIADHGNSDNAINPDGSPNTAHSLNPVPIIVIDDEVKTVKNGTLRDVAPTILDLMQVQKSNEMTGNSLIER